MSTSVKGQVLEISCGQCQRSVDFVKQFASHDFTIHSSRSTVYYELKKNPLNCTLDRWVKQLVNLLQSLKTLPMSFESIGQPSNHKRCIVLT